MHAAVRKLYSFYRTFKRLTGDQRLRGADDATPIARLAAHVLDALHALHAAARPDIPGAGAVYDCVWDVQRDRYSILTSDMRRRLEDLCATNRVFGDAASAYRASRDAKRSSGQPDTKGSRWQPGSPSRSMGGDRPPSRMSAGPRAPSLAATGQPSANGEAGMSPTTPPDNMAMSPVSEGEAPSPPGGDAAPLMEVCVWGGSSLCCIADVCVQMFGCVLMLLAAYEECKFGLYG